MAAFSTSELTIDDLVTVQTKAWTARQKWYNIGLRLGLKVDVLDCIQMSPNNTDPDSCFTAMLKAWLRQENIEKTWNKLVMALSNDTVGFSDLANSIVTTQGESTNRWRNQCYSSGPTTECHNKSGLGEAPKLSFQQSDKYDDPSAAEGNQCTTMLKSLALQKSEWTGFICPCGQCSIEKFFETGCPQSSNPGSKTYPFLNTEHMTDHERYELHFKLNEETKTILTEFSDLINHVIKSFKKQEVDPQDIKTSVLTFAPQLIPSEILKCTKTINEIINALTENGFLSFFNYHIAEHLIKQHGTCTDEHSFKGNASCSLATVTVQQALESYKTKLINFVSEAYSKSIKVSLHDLLPVEKY